MISPQAKSFGLASLRGWIVATLVVLFIGLVIAPGFDAVLHDVVIYAGINIILAVSLNLINGFTGQFSIGHAGFMAVGAYTAAVITANLMNPALFGLSLMGGALAAAAVGYVVGLPSLRLRGDYLAIVTLGFGEIIRVVILNLEFLGGARGLSGIPRLTSFLWVYGAVAVTLFIIVRMITSSHGRALMAVREDEIAAQAMGVNTTQAKVRAFVVGAFFAGLAGGLYGHYLTILSPSDFDFNRSFEVVIMVVLGGMGSLTGSVVAAVSLTFLREYLRDLQAYTQVDLRMIIYSLILISLMLIRPKGLLGKSELVDGWRKLRSFRRGQSA